MKKRKIILIASIAITTILISGCGKETKLSCTQNASGVDIKFNVGFKGNTIKTIDVKYDMDLSKYSNIQIEAIEKQNFCSIVKSAMNEYKDAFTDCDQKIKNKHLKVDSSLDVNKIAKNALGKIKSPKKAKEQLESQGYTCTIK